MADDIVVSKEEIDIARIGVMNQVEARGLLPLFEENEAFRGFVENQIRVISYERAHTNKYADLLGINLKKPDIKKGKVFKIRNTKTGLYSKGGMDCHKSDWNWSKQGKSWASYAALKLHIAQYRTIPEEWEVEVYDRVEVLKISANKV